MHGGGDVLSGNLYGVSVASPSGNAIVTLESPRMAGNGNCGISVSSTGAVARVSRSALTLNGFGACFSGRVVSSLGTNMISDNSLGDANGGSIGTISQK